jgi:MFS family permease
MNSLKNHVHMGKIARATRVATHGMEPGHARIIIILLAICTALQMIGFGMIFPLFARKIGDFGGGMEVLATSLMAYSLAGMVASPIMGTLADRYGRRPLLIGSLAVFIAAFSGYFLATSSWVFITIRGVAGGLTAGYFPATMGIVADIAPENERARWIGIISGGSSTGWIVGPLVGGLLFDKWGYGIPFAIAIGMNVIAFLITIFFIPESHTKKERRRAILRQKRITRLAPETSATASFWSSLPHPLLAFGILLFINLSMIFAWFFIEPHLPFYVFDELGWSTAQFGATVSFYGWASLIGSLTLSQSSDRFGRKPVLIVGLILHSAQYIGLMLTSVYWVIILAFIFAGLGEALTNPALSASFLDITPEEHRARAMGIKNAIGALGNLSAPALVMLVIHLIPPQSVFLVSALLLLLTAVVVFGALRLPSRAEVARDLSWAVTQERIMAAHSALHGVALSASTTRKLKGTV